MRVEFVNQTSYKQLEIICNEERIELKKDESAFVDVFCNEAEVEVSVFEKNRVLLNLLFALVDGFIDGESVINSLHCNARFNLQPVGSDETVVLENLEHRDDENGYIYESVYMENSNAKNISYFLTDIKKARRKALFYYIFLVSWLPIVILFGCFFLFKGSIFDIVAGLICLLVFSVPAWKKAARVKKYYSSEYANEVLTKQAELKSLGGNNPDCGKPRNFIEKAVYKVLDFIFKNKGEREN